MKLSVKLYFLLAIILIIAVIAVVVFSGTTEGNYDTFSQCLSNNGVKMYGAYWCGHCNNQKEMFGSSWKYVNYIECATPNNGQTDKCLDAGIEAYPTWEFIDGSRIVSEMSFEELSEKTGCEIGE